MRFASFYFLFILSSSIFFPLYFLFQSFPLYKVVSDLVNPNVCRGGEWRDVFPPVWRHHADKVVTVVCVEECSFEIGRMMNNAIVLFLNTVEKPDELIKSGVVIGVSHTHP